MQLCPHGRRRFDGVLMIDEVTDGDLNGGPVSNTVVDVDVASEHLLRSPKSSKTSNAWSS
jgi:hypothetical protein